MQSEVMHHYRLQERERVRSVVRAPVLAEEEGVCFRERRVVECCYVELQEVEEGQGG